MNLDRLKEYSLMLPESTSRPPDIATVTAGLAVRPTVYTIQRLLSLRRLDMCKQLRAKTIPLILRADSKLHPSELQKKICSGGGEVWGTSRRWDLSDEKAAQICDANESTAHIRSDNMNRNRRYDNERRDGGGDDNMNWRSESRILPQLASTENSWLAVQRKIKNESSASEIVLRKLRSMLNKLTTTNFEKLYGQLKAGETGMTTYEELKGLVMLIFEKATTQHKYISMYVKFCARLCEDIDESNFATSEDGRIFFKTSSSDLTTSTENVIEATTGASKSSLPLMRRLLINVSQDVFEKQRVMPPVPEGLNGDEEFEYIIAFKHKFKGNMIFAGELAVAGLLALKVIFECATELAQSQAVHELEGLCVLLTTVAHASLVKYPSKTATLCMEIETSSKREEIPLRVRCLLRDALDFVKQTKKTVDLAPKESESHVLARGGPSASMSMTTVPMSSVGQMDSKDEDGFTVVSKAKSKKGSQPIKSASFQQPPQLISRSQQSTRYVPAFANRGSISNYNRTPSDRQQRTIIEPLKKMTPISETPSAAPTATSSVMKQTPKSFDHCLQEVLKIEKDLIISSDLEEARRGVTEQKIPEEHQAAIVREILHDVMDKNEVPRKLCIQWIVRWPADGTVTEELYRQGLFDYIETFFHEDKVDQPNLEQIIRDELCGLGRKMASRCFSDDFIVEVEARMAAPPEVI